MFFLSIFVSCCPLYFTLRLSASIPWKLWPTGLEVCSFLWSLFSEGCCSQSAWLLCDLVTLERKIMVSHIPVMLGQRGSTFTMYYKQTEVLCSKAHTYSSYYIRRLSILRHFYMTELLVLYSPSAQTRFRHSIYFLLGAMTFEPFLQISIFHSYLKNMIKDRHNCVGFSKQLPYRYEHEYEWGHCLSFDFDPNTICSCKGADKEISLSLHSIYYDCKSLTWIRCKCIAVLVSSCSEVYYFDLH